MNNEQSIYQEKRHKNKREETNMSTHIKKSAQLKVIGLAVLGLLAMSRTFVHADTNPGNDSAALMVRITPNVDRGVSISSSDLSTGQIDLGYVSLGASTWTVHPATVTIQGNVLNTELDLAASIAGGWVFNNAQTLASTASAANQLNAWVTFTSISTGIAPAQDDEYFRVGTTSGAKITSLTQTMSARTVGLTPTSGIGFFESNESGNADMDSMNPADKRHMYTYFTLPPVTSITSAQDINFVLSVRAGQ